MPLKPKHNSALEDVPNIHTQEKISELQELTPVLSVPKDISADKIKKLSGTGDTFHKSFLEDRVASIYFPRQREAVTTAMYKHFVHTYAEPERVRRSHSMEQPVLNIADAQKKYTSLDTQLQESSTLMVQRTIGGNGVRELSKVGLKTQDYIDAYIDPMTGVFNYHGYKVAADIIKQELSKLEGDRATYLVCTSDGDNFKLLNYIGGTEFGDLLIRQAYGMAEHRMHEKLMKVNEQRVQDGLPEAKIISIRDGGEEFSRIAIHLPPEEFHRLLDELRQDIEQEIRGLLRGALQNNGEGLRQSLSKLVEQSEDKQTEASDELLKILMLLDGKPGVDIQDARAGGSTYTVMPVHVSIGKSNQNVGIHSLMEHKKKADQILALYKNAEFTHTQDRKFPGRNHIHMLRDELHIPNKQENLSPVHQEISRLRDEIGLMNKRMVSRLLYYIQVGSDPRVQEDALVFGTTTLEAIRKYVLHGIALPENTKQYLSQTEHSDESLLFFIEDLARFFKTSYGGSLTQIHHQTTHLDRLFPLILAGILKKPHATDEMILQDASVQQLKKYFMDTLLRSDYPTVNHQLLSSNQLPEAKEDALNQIRGLSLQFMQDTDPKSRTLRQDVLSTMYQRMQEQSPEAADLACMHVHMDNVKPLNEVLGHDASDVFSHIRAKGVRDIICALHSADGRTDHATPQASTFMDDTVILNRRKAEPITLEKLSALYNKVIGEPSSLSHRTANDLTWEQIRAAYIYNEQQHGTSLTLEDFTASIMPLLLRAYVNTHFYAEVAKGGIAVEEKLMEWCNKHTKEFDPNSIVFFRFSIE